MDRSLPDGSLLLCLFSQEPACAFSYEVGSRKASSCLLSHWVFACWVLPKVRMSQTLRRSHPEQVSSTCLGCVFCLFKPASLSERWGKGPWGSPDTLGQVLTTLQNVPRGNQCPVKKFFLSPPFMYSCLQPRNCVISCFHMHWENGVFSQTEAVTELKAISENYPYDKQIY